MEEPKLGQDARIRYTQTTIKQKFIELLQRQPINRVTVTRICELAEINRATFYKYYSDPFDLLDKIEEELIQELKRYMGRSEPEKEDIIGTLTLMLEKIQANSELYTVLASENGDSKFPARIFSAGYEQIATESKRLPSKLTEIQREWFYLFVAQGSSGILNRWMKGGMREPIGEVAAFMERLIANSMSRF